MANHRGDTPPSGGQTGARAVDGDIGRIIVRILGRIMAGEPLKALMGEIVALVAEWSGFEAVGIRLREGEDFPYVQTRGMRQEFVDLESSLCPYQDKARAGHGEETPLLECACGRVIQERIDRSDPSYTEYGSFWTNNSSELMASSPESLEYTRGRCVAEGYLSTALIPLRCDGETYGLLQLEDKRPGMLTREMLTALEQIAMIAALAMAQRDASRRLEAAGETARRQASQLERRGRELQDFVHMASHDLQEPLRKILAFGERLRTSYGDRLDERGLDYLGRMESAATRMTHLLDSLLVYSRVCSRPQPFEPVDLGETARAALSDLHVLLEKSGGRVEVGDLPAVEADRSQMRQVFMNLMGNALKFHAPGVAPLVRVRPVGPCPAEDGMCRIAVEDNGIGIEERFTEKIFAPFARLHGRGEYEGTGMGLAIVRRIVERHGGAVHAESTPGQGTTFVVVLPARQSGLRGRNGDAAG